MPSIKTSPFANVKRNVFLSTVIIIALFLALILFDPSGFEALVNGILKLTPFTLKMAK